MFGLESRPNTELPGQSGSGGNEDLVCESGGADLETKRLSVTVSFTMFDVNFLDENLAGTLTSINLLERKLLKEVSKLMTIYF